MIDLDALERRAKPFGERSGRQFYVPPVIALAEFDALIAELRASREVARRAQHLINELDADSGISPAQWDALRATLAELEALK